MYKGVFTALLTPFKHGELDLDSFAKMIEWQIESGVDGLVVAGSTGEGQNLTKEEMINLLEIAIKIAKGRVKIIANASSNSTDVSIDLVKEMEKLKIDGVMVVTPYYVKPTQEGAYQHFKAIHDACKFPLIIYNNPARAAVDLTNETMIRLSHLQRVKAVKECSGNPIRCAQILEQKPSLEIMCGDDILMLPYYTQGASGVISVVSNLVPALVVKLHKMWKESNPEEAMKTQSLLRPLNEAIFCEPNPVAVKFAASLFGICAPDLRLPLVPLSEANKKLVTRAIQQLKDKIYG